MSDLGHTGPQPTVTTVLMASHLFVLPLSIVVVMMRISVVRHTG